MPNQFIITIANRSAVAIDTPLFLELQASVGTNHGWSTVGFVPFVGGNGTTVLCGDLQNCEAAPLLAPIKPDSVSVWTLDEDNLPDGRYRVLSPSIPLNRQDAVETDLP